MEDDDNGIIRLKSSDEKVFELTEKAASISELVQDSPRLGDDEITEIEISRVNSDCLELVVKFMNHYEEEKMKEIPTPLGGSTFDEVRPQKSVRSCVSSGTKSFCTSLLTFPLCFYFNQCRLWIKSGTKILFQMKIWIAICYSTC